MRNWRKWSCCALAALAFTSTAALAAKPKPAQPPVPADEVLARHQATLAFQHDLISVLAVRADAKPLLAAALLARPLEDKSLAASYPILIGRAVKAPGTGAFVSWQQLLDCKAAADDCPNSQALDRLQQQAPDNAAVWLLKLAQDLRNEHADAARQDLAKAAASHVYDDYVGAAQGALTLGVNTLPPPKATYVDTGAGPAGVRLLVVLATGATLPRPVLPVTAQYCEEKAAKDSGIKHDCQQLSQLLAWGSSAQSRSLGLHLREVLSDDPAEKKAAQHAWASLAWQIQNFAQMAQQAQNDKTLAQHMLDLTGHGGTEMSLIYAALHDTGVSLDAPAGWKPLQDEVRPAAAGKLPPAKPKPKPVS